MQFYTSILRNELTEEVVVVEGQGQGMSEAKIIDKTISAKDRLKAAESLAKRYGLDRPVDKQDDIIEIILRRE